MVPRLMRDMFLIMLIVFPTVMTVVGVASIRFAVVEGGWNWLFVVLWIPFLVFITGYSIDVMFEAREAAKEEIHREKR